MTDGSPSRLTVDWSTISLPSQLYDNIFSQMGVPLWHGRNLDALNDSWVNGGVCSSGPPFVFYFLNDVASDAMIKHRTAVEEIARESVQKHGGRLILRR